MNEEPPHHSSESNFIPTVRTSVFNYYSYNLKLRSKSYLLGHILSNHEEDCKYSSTYTYDYCPFVDCKYLFTRIHIHTLYIFASTITKIFHNIFWISFLYPIFLPMPKQEAFFSRHLLPIQNTSITNGAS